MSSPAVDTDACWRRTPRVLSAPISNQLLVFDAHERRAHLLNPSAAATWLACDGATGLPDLIDALADHFAIDARAIDTDVAAVVRELADLGLLLSSDSIADATEHSTHEDDWDDAAAPTSTSGASIWGGPLPPELDDVEWPHVIGPFRALHVDVDIACTDPLVARHLARVLRPLQSDSPARHRYRLATTPARGPAPLPGADVIAFDDMSGESPTTAARTVAWVLWHLNTLVSTTATDRLQFHASGVADDRGRVIAFPAEMNSGKSTLVAGLVQGGMAYVTDETVAVDPDTLIIVPYPKAIGLDPGSWSVLPELEPQLPEDEAPFAASKWYVDPAEVGPSAGPGPLSLVIFPRYDPDHPTELTPLSPTQAATRLAECAFNVDHLGQRGLDTLVAIAADIPAYSLSVHDLDTACATVVDVVRHLDQISPRPGVTP